MKYYINVDGSRRNKNGLIPVRILFKEEGKRFLVDTGMETEEKLNGMAFPTASKNARAKTARLVKIFDDIDRCLLKMPANTDWETKKKVLRCAVTGRETQKAEKTLAEYVEEFAASKTNTGTRGLYMATAKKLREFDASAIFGSVSTEWLDKWAAANAHMSTNGFSIHLRNLRTVFNWAIDNEYTDKYPFRRYKVKNEQVAIRNISVDELRAIRDWPVEDWQGIYRDLFMLTFYLCGINPIDLLHLKKQDMRNGRIRYRRRKTGRLYDIPVPTPAMEIISRYAGKEWLLRPLDDYSDYKDFCHHWNDALKKIGKSEKVADKAGKKRKIAYRPIVEGLTVYVARYTFASIGAEIDIPRETIALCLGHTWADVTSRYIAYDTRKIDDAVKKIVGYVGEK